ncbi:hypothetical protein CAPTEDRAFT_199821 [Capitella teleta]|uniref:Tudor domain-containing protein n=1 Tax=Capitella teleta TaxID=283909 RepID=R7UZ58_CAPTE|nr:hypothetical protein CAPTEDRAFT_199821 [Capitella teleta]|eukprot:ELU11858.1 hypothetical protein CAPTEDRAFT_199821 [Capitella teleta]
MKNLFACSDFIIFGHLDATVDFFIINEFQFSFILDEDDIWKEKTAPTKRKMVFSQFHYIMPGGFKSGDVVEPIWPPNQHWYEAEILSTDNDGMKDVEAYVK